MQGWPGVAIVWGFTALRFVGGRGVFVLSFALLAGCVNVPPYQRQQLAHPSMTTDDMSTPVDGHVRGVSEGAAGGLSAGGGGCGCN